MKTENRASYMKEYCGKNRDQINENQRIYRKRVNGKSMIKFANPKGQETHMRIEQYEGLRSLIAEWEQQPAEIQVENHDYILGLKKRQRMIKNLITHRRDPASDFYQKSY